MICRLIGDKFNRHRFPILKISLVQNPLTLAAYVMTHNIIFPQYKVCN